MIKVPLVRDTLLLVLDQLEHHYPFYKENQTKVIGLNDQKFDKNSNIGSTQSIPSTIGNLSSKSTIDDLGLLNRTKKPHLSEVFK